MASGLSARIPRKLLDDGGPALAAHLTEHLGRLLTDAVVAGRRTRALELADALRSGADDPGLARAAAELREFHGANRVVVGTGLIEAFTRLAARGMLAEPDRETRLASLERLARWSFQPATAGASAEVRELLVAERRAEGGTPLLRELTTLAQTIALPFRAECSEELRNNIAAYVDEILDLSEDPALDEADPLPGLMRRGLVALSALHSLQGAKGALAASARLVTLVETRTAPGVPEDLPPLEKVIDKHISRLLELDRLDDAIACSRRLLDRYESLGAGVDPGAAAINHDRHAHLLDRAERHEEALEASERAIAIGAKAENFGRLAGLLRFHSDRLLAVGRESEAIEVAKRAVEAGERAESPLETAFSLGDLTAKLLDADRDDEAYDWSRRTLRAWGELLNDGVEIAGRNLAAAMMNRRVLMHRRGDVREALMSAKSAQAFHHKAVYLGDSAARPRLAECLLAMCADMEILGETDRLDHYAHRAVEAYEELAAEFPGRFDVELNTALDRYARALENAGRLGEAVAASLRNIAVCERQATGDPADRRALAGAAADCARRMAADGDVEAGLEHSERAVALFGDLVAADPAAYRDDARFVNKNHAALLSIAGRFDEALVHVRCLLAESEDLVAEDRARNLGHLAMAYDDEAHHLRLAGRVEEAVTAADQALRTWREAAALHPEVRRAIAGALAWHAELRAELGDPVMAAALAEEADRLAAALG